MTRYAIYFTPARTSWWWQQGCRWLGRDPESGVRTDLPPIAGVSSERQMQLTQHARRYGFHATLKAPFQLAQGFNEMHLMSMAQAFARCQNAIEVRQPTVRALGAFLALQPAAAQNDINALAMRCVSYFDVLRALPTVDELARRRQAGLSPRQEALLLRWGYPYTEEAYRFHMTLTDAMFDPASDTASNIGGDTMSAMRAAAQDSFAAAKLPPLMLDGLAIFRESAPGNDFDLIARMAFSSQTAAPTLPTPGTLFFLVGASGSGKDTLLRWVAAHLPPSSKLVFARRTITRAADANEDSEALDVAAFWQAAAAGEFAMLWQANDLCYAVRRGIEADLLAGRDVIINGSREYIPHLRQAYPAAQVIWIEAGAEQIRRRIVDRRRESGPALLRRLERVTQFSTEGDDALRVCNDGTVDQAGEQLLAILMRTART